MRALAMPPDTSTAPLLPGAQFGDAFQVSTTDPVMDAPLAAYRMMGRSPPWVRALMRVRNAIVSPFGLKAPDPLTKTPGQIIGAFPVISSSPNRVVMGFDDKHLDFRVGDCGALYLDIAGVVEASEWALEFLVPAPPAIGAQIVQ